MQSGKTDAKCSPSQKSDDIIFERLQFNIPDPDLVTLKPKKKKKERTYAYAKTKQPSVLRVAEFVERRLITVIGWGVVTKIK